MQSNFNVRENLPNCRECGVAPGELHEDGCEHEQCYACGQMACNLYHLLECPMSDEEFADDERMPWTGVCPGLEDCQRHELYFVTSPNVLCPPETPGAKLNLNFLAVYGIWDPDQKKFVGVEPGPAAEAKELYYRLESGDLTLSDACDLFPGRSWTREKVKVLCEQIKAGKGIRWERFPFIESNSAGLLYHFQWDRQAKKFK